MSQRSLALHGNDTLDCNSILSIAGLSGVRIQTAPVPTRLDGATAEGVLWQAAPGLFLLHLPGVARFLVQHGCSLTIDPEPGARPSELQRFLRMTPLAALLYQRGTLALHAAAAANAGGVVLLAGDSGAGKSALLMALIERGWTLVAEDLTIVETDAHGGPVVPMFPEIGPGPRIPGKPEPRHESELARACDAVPCRTLLIPDPPADAPHRLHAIHWLTVHNEDRICCRKLHGIERFRALATLTYQSRIADVLLNRSDYLRQAARIGQTVPILRWSRPRGRDTVEELADSLVRSSIPLPAHSVRSITSGARS